MGNDSDSTAAGTHGGAAPHFFDEPVLDDLLHICLELAGQLWVTSSRLRRLEALVEVDGRLAAELIEAQVDAEDDPEGYEAARDQFVERIFAVLTQRNRAPATGVS